MPYKSHEKLWKIEHFYWDGRNEYHLMIKLQGKIIFDIPLTSDQIDTLLALDVLKP